MNLKYEMPMKIFAYNILLALLLLSGWTARAAAQGHKVTIMGYVYDKNFRTPLIGGMV